MHLARLIGPELEQLLSENPAEVRELLSEIHPADIAELLSELSDERAAQLLMELPPEYAAQVFEHVNENRQGTFAKRMGVESTTLIAAEMEADDRADFFSNLPPALQKPILANLERIDPEAAEEVEELNRWSDHSAGGLMTTEFVAVAPHFTINDAIEEIRSRAQDAATIDPVYVVADNERLLGLLTLRDLFLARPRQVVSAVMHEHVISVPPDMDQEEVAKQLAKYDFSTMAVVGSDGRMLGVITSDDILDVVHQEQAEDVQKMGAMAPIEQGYFDASFSTYIKKRAPWLAVLFIGGFFTTTAMKHFDGILRALTHIAFYVPLLISAGGNSGSQSSTLVIRGLAVGEVQSKDFLRVLRRELAQGVALGIMLAGFGVLRVAIAGDGVAVAALVALTLIGIVVMGCVVGGMLPLFLHKLGLDPATSSAPFIATLVDVLGILIYLNLAQHILLPHLVAIPATH
ncbi:MAG TPA: magnesium transporter [Polyangiaceae bacterium]